MKSDDVFSLPSLIVSDGAGSIFDIPELKMAGMTGPDFTVPVGVDLVPLPEGSDLMELPGRVAVGYDPVRDSMVSIAEYRGKRVVPVAAFMAPAHVQLLRCAYRREPDAPMLPLYSYTAAGWKDGDFFAAGLRIDPDTRQDLGGMDCAAIETGAQELLERYPENRLICHLVDNCVRRYGCPAARNLALGRFEAPLPTSPSCNSRCVGCLSLQQGTNVPCAQDRISFVPDPGEIIEIAVPHLEHAVDAVVSFGQGCEGEPLMQADMIAEAVRGIRKRTGRGIININTNASVPESISMLIESGVDSVRVSLNSAREEYYMRYFRPANYTFGDVVESMKVITGMHAWCSINYFIFPGFTDSPREMEAFAVLVKATGARLVQMRNLNLDPDLYLQTMGIDAFEGDPAGMASWMACMKESCSHIRFGYFNPPARRMY